MSNVSSLLETLKSEAAFWQQSFCGAVSVGEAYRGDLILVPGRINASGNQNPPEMLVNQTLMTVVDGKISFLAGYVHNLADISKFVEKFLSYAKEGISLFFFVEDIKEELTVEINGHAFYFFPLDEGTVWNAFTEELGLEKGDFKGLDAGEKIVKVAEEGAGFKPKKSAQVSMEEALGRTVEVHKEARGPV